jgi:hypothetical protein
MVPVYILQHAYKIMAITSQECPVIEIQKPLKISLWHTANKVIGGLTHPVHQFPGMLNNGWSLTPRDGSRQKSSDLNIEKMVILMGNGNRIFFNKGRAVILPGFLLQKFLQLSYCQRDRHSGLLNHPILYGKHAVGHMGQVQVVGHYHDGLIITFA